MTTAELSAYALCHVADLTAALTSTAPDFLYTSGANHAPPQTRAEVIASASVNRILQPVASVLLVS